MDHLRPRGSVQAGSTGAIVPSGEERGFRMGYPRSRGSVREGPTVATVPGDGDREGIEAVGSDSIVRDEGIRAQLWRSLGSVSV